MSLYEAARRVSEEIGHTPSCQFTGCTCGQASKLADALVDLRVVLRKATP